MNEEEHKPFWQRKELWGGLALLGLAGVQFPAHTLMFQIGTFLNAAVGIGLSFFGIKKGNEAKNLPFQENSKIQLPEGLRKK